MSNDNPTNEQELDEILERIEELSLLVSAENSVTGSNVYGSPSAAVNRVKQTILAWHNKQVEAVLDRLERRSDGLPCTVRYSDGSVERMRVVPLSAIEAEQAKLKEVK